MASQPPSPTSIPGSRPLPLPIGLGGDAFYCTFSEVPLRANITIEICTNARTGNTTLLGCIGGKGRMCVFLLKEDYALIMPVVEKLRKRMGQLRLAGDWVYRHPVIDDQGRRWVPMFSGAAFLDEDVFRLVQQSGKEARRVCYGLPGVVFYSDDK